MKILQINKFFYIRGGASRYFFELSGLLSRKKHYVSFFSMKDEKNKESYWSNYFVSGLSPMNFDRMFYSIEVNRKLSKLLGEFSPDVVHLHSIYHQLSSSMLLEFKKRNVPVVQTVHDYHLISLNYNLFHNGKICEETRPNLFYKAILHKCMKDSYIYSLIEVIEKYFQYFVGWERNLVNLFIAPSNFMKKKLIEYGIDPIKVIHLPYFVDISAYKPNYENDDYILFFGRLSPEKGLSFLIDVMRQLPKVQLLIAGRGDEESVLLEKVKKLQLTNIKFIGFKDGEKLKNLIRNARFTVLPSLWYDVAPISILEANACGKPMVASDIGGIPELVKDGLTGLLLKPGDIKDCREKILKLWNNPALYRRLGKNAREFAEKNFGPEEHYDKLMKIYNKLLH